MDFLQILRKIENFPTEKLPAKNSHMKLAPQFRLKDFESADLSKAKKSAVLILLHPENNNTYITFIKKTVDGTHHSGQIAFPGGKFETEDKDLVNTALRETCEEIGIHKNDVKIIKQLTTLFIPVSNFSVTPFVGYITTKPEYKKSNAEVEQIFTMSANQIININIEIKKINIRGVSAEVPLFDYNGFTIWGATAMILNEFKEILQYIEN